MPLRSQNAKSIIAFVYNNHINTAKEQTKVDIIFISPMAQYKQSDITDIYWASNEGFKGGRDPLGIQNSSIATYTKLLPGLTNLTRHIRYYSLYCWLLSEYDKLEISGKTSLHQYNFIRRAELGMAFIMKDQGVGSIVGAMFINQKRYKLIDEGIYNIADGADFDSNEKYWTFKTGAFGQYYLGSLIYYELVKIEEGRFYLRKKGKELAMAFSLSVEANTRDLFIECILDGRIEEKEINKLQSLAIHNIALKSKEWQSLNHLLIKEDEESSFRKETIYLLLRDLNNAIEIDDFVKNRFLHVNEDKSVAASFGWYFYYLCECLHYSVDSIFCLVLNKIHDLHNPPIRVLTEDIVSSIMSTLDGKYKTIDEWKNDTLGNIDELYDKLRETIKNQEYIQAAFLSLTLLLRLFNEFEMNKKAILGFEKQNDLKRQRGILSEGLNAYVSQYLSWPISKYIPTLVTQIMQEHTIIAIGKMGRNNSDLRKFIYEEGRIVLVEIRYPVETSPRVDSLFNYLKDLSYLDSNNNLTDVAYNFLRNYGKK